jgi:hypothetical protein
MTLPRTVAGSSVTALNNRVADDGKGKGKGGVFDIHASVVAAVAKQRTKLLMEDLILSITCSIYESRQ